MSTDLPQGDLPPQGKTTQHVADAILARRQSGDAPIPEGPAPDVEAEEYQPGKNAVTESDVEHRSQDLDTVPEPDVSEEDAATDQDVELAGEDELTDADVDDDQAPRFEYIDEIADAAGVPLDDLLADVKIRTIVDGEHGEVSLAELRKGHQLEKSFTRKNQRFVEERKQFAAEQEQKRNELNDQFAQAGAVFEAAQQQLYADFQGIDWNKLQVDDPAQWQAKRQQFGERQARLNHVIQTTSQQLNEAREAQAAKDEETRQRHLQSEHQMLMEKIPEWQDENKAQTEGPQVAQYLHSLGYTTEELDGLNDHRLIVLARAALGLSGATKAKIELAKKKARTLKPRVSPGSGHAPRGSGATQAAKDATAKAKRTGDPNDVAEALIARRQARAQAAKRGRRARI